MNIYVGNLSYGVVEEDLKEIFEEYGNVDSVKIITDKFSGKSKGFGFVEMAGSDDAKKAIEELNGGTLDNRKVIVNEARPRTNNNRF
ncbi:MAG: RNA-binding protein [Bacteroidales bacterium]|nr:RNA-binding protein [Bacteroidales bacterium]MBN2818112.1 RNA-binding protein [Bacteroidales bacterium]